MMRLRSSRKGSIGVAVVLLFTCVTLKTSFNLLSYYSRDLTFGVSSADASDASKEAAANAFNSRITAYESERQPSRISITLHPKELRPYTNSFNPFAGCPIVDANGKKKGRLGLPAEMKNATGVLDFTTSVTTDLKILFMGDSVSMQYSQGFEEGAGALHAHRTVLRYSWGFHEGLHVSAPVRGGGVVAGWRITDLLSRKGENKPLPVSDGGGWVRNDVHNLTAHTYNVTDDQGEVEGSNTVGSFDAMVLRIPHGWITLDQISEKALNETVHLAHELFGVSSIVLISLPFVNNVITMEDWRLLKEKNTLIRDFVRNWDSSGGARSSGVKHLLLLEFGDFADSLMEWNARLMGFDTSVANYTMETLAAPRRGGFTKSIAQVCSTRVPVGTKNCDGNSITGDGLHWCMETVGGRFFAGTSCLLACAFNKNETRDESTSTTSTTTGTTAIRQCEQRCNDDFMSLKPVDVSSMVER
jgi:hypothetical protein